MTHIFYENHAPEDPLLAHLFANMAADHPERVAAWLGETFGGPQLYSESYGGYDRRQGRHHALRRRLAPREDRGVRTLGRSRHAAMTTADPPSGRVPPTKEEAP
jgi:truncated hemoglobin YjbI